MVSNSIFICRPYIFLSFGACLRTLFEVSFPLIALMHLVFHGIFSDYSNKINACRFCVEQMIDFLKSQNISARFKQIQIYITTLKQQGF